MDNNSLAHTKWECKCHIGAIMVAENIRQESLILSWILI